MPLDRLTIARQPAAPTAPPGNSGATGCHVTHAQFGDPAGVDVTRASSVARYAGCLHDRL